MKRILAVILVAGMMSLPGMQNSVSARKIVVKPPRVAQSSNKTESKGEWLASEDFEQAGFDASELVFTGYDKPWNSTKETFFVTNHTGRHLTEISLQINYYDMSGYCIHERDVTVNLDLPAESTRQACVSSWDKQKSFHYKNSKDNRRSPTQPFGVKLTLKGVREAADN